MYPPLPNNLQFVILLVARVAPLFTRHPLKWSGASNAPLNLVTVLATADRPKFLGHILRKCPSNLPLLVSPVETLLNERSFTLIGPKGGLVVRLPRLVVCLL